MFEQIFRRACSECGGPIVWLTPAQAAKDPQLAKLLEEARQWVMGPIESVWRCTRCGETGFFGSWHMAG